MFRFIARLFNKLMQFIKLNYKKEPVRQRKSKMRHQCHVVKGRKSESISFIGGADGPTSIFIAEKDESMHSKRKEMIKQKCKTLVPNAHSFDELVNYITSRYHAEKVSDESLNYKEEYRNIKSNLVLKERPDLIHNPIPERPKREQMSDPEFMSNYFKQIEKRTREASDIKDSVFPIDLEQYLITVSNGKFHGQIIISLEYEFELLGISTQFDNNQDTKSANLCDKIIRDIYHFYGVTKEDIDSQNERCQMYIHMVG